MEEKKLRFRALVPIVLMAAAFSGCAASQKRAVKTGQVPLPLQTAGKSELIQRYNQLANSITSLNASVTLQLTSGSKYTGTIEQYHEVTGFILAQKPSNIRVIGQVPVVGKNIFDMESNGATFHVFVPSKNQFIVGPAGLERPSEKPIENLRPQHLLDAIFWEPIPNDAPVLLEQATVTSSSFYILTVVRAIRSTDWEIARKIWFDRTNLNMIRIDIFDPDGAPSALVRYSDWSLFGPASGSVRYPRQILLNRLMNDYQLQITVTKLAVNEPISPDRFTLAQPSGTELVRVGENSQEAKP